MGTLLRISTCVRYNEILVITNTIDLQDADVKYTSI